MDNIKIVRTRSFDRDVLVLIQHHSTLMRSTSPPESVHTLEAKDLAGDNIEFYTLKENGALLGIAALKIHLQLGGEIKSMHIIKAARGQGLSHRFGNFLIARARTLGFPSLYLETGVEPEFYAARALYKKLGFKPCAPFADYTKDPNSLFMHLDLNATTPTS